MLLPMRVSSPTLVIGLAMLKLHHLAPNGASMRPLGDMQTRLVEGFKGSKVVVYAIPEGMPSESLVLATAHIPRDRITR
jgi:hypothetical protein